jgi:hypothetical protein
MRTGRALVLMAMLAVRPICVLGDSTVSPPNPIGEKVYYTHLHAHLLSEMLPIAIIVCAFLLAWLLHVAHRKATKLAPDNAESYDI